MHMNTIWGESSYRESPNERREREHRQKVMSEGMYRGLYEAVPQTFAPLMLAPSYPPQLTPQSDKLLLLLEI